MSAPKHPRKPVKLAKEELAFRQERGQKLADQARASVKPQRFSGTAKVCRKRPGGRLSP